MQTETLKAAEIKVSYHPANSSKPIIKSSLDAYNVLLDFFPETTIHLQERFVVMYLNRANKVIGVFPVSIGGITSTVVDIRLILSVALTTATTSIILAHNHPSGAIKPSKVDIELTTKIKEAGKYMDIPVNDHIIISSERGKYFSFAEDGLI